MFYNIRSLNQILGNDPDADDHLPTPFGDSHNPVINL